MEYSEALKLKERWGKTPCDHPEFEKVYFFGTYLVNYACTKCGADLTIPRKLEIEEARKKKKIS